MQGSSRSGQRTGRLLAQNHLNNVEGCASVMTALCFGHMSAGALARAPRMALCAWLLLLALTPACVTTVDTSPPEVARAEDDIAWAESILLQEQEMARRLQAESNDEDETEEGEEWGCTDPKLAEALLRRKQKMQRAGRKTEQKRNQKDPMKRLAALQRKVAVLPPHAEAQHSPRQPLVLARHEPGAAENAGMRRLLSPRRLRLGDEGGYAAGCEEEIPQEIEADLELDLASDELHDEPLRSFSSDAPNAKLRRSMRTPPRAPSAPLPRAELPTGSRSLNGSRLSSPVAHGVGSLPVGSALQAARASSAGRFSGT